MKLLFNGKALLAITLLYAAGIYSAWSQHQMAELMLLARVVPLLLSFSLIARIAMFKNKNDSQEIVDRTVSWYWMVGLFFLFNTLGFTIQLFFFGYLSFMALREFFSNLPMYKENAYLRPEDKSAILAAYLSIPIMFYLIYIGWNVVFYLFVPVWAFLVISTLLVLKNEPKKFIFSSGTITYGLILFVFLFGHAGLLAQLDTSILLFAVILTEVRDVLAFSIGKTLKGLRLSFFHKKVAEQISPNKNWGTVIVSTLAMGFIALSYYPHLEGFPPGQLTPNILFGVGILIGLVGFIGDLVSSAIKRDLQIKDFGTLIPGHGGIIDRIDSLCFTLPVIYHVLYFFCFSGR